jgi:8-oxo-dGTP pyrophosphatase MutT (NUDIX family)
VSHADVTPVPIRPASTVVVVRPGDAAAPDVLLVRRTDRVAFMAGAHVFPGGRVDEADRSVRLDAAFLRQPPRFPDVSVHDELPYRVAAVREAQEEAGLTLDVDALHPIAHWVTPAIEIRRFDTRFFLAVLPEGQRAVEDMGEITAHVWLTAGDALQQAQAGHLHLPPPTWTTLRQIEQRGSLPDVLAWARTKPIVRVSPTLLEDSSAGVRMLALPGDPAVPMVDGWDVPPETRFVLREGQGWLPVRP